MQPPNQVYLRRVQNLFPPPPQNLQVEVLARQMLVDPIEIQVGGRSVVNADITQQVRGHPPSPSPYTTSHSSSAEPAPLIIPTPRYLSKNVHLL